MLQAGNMDESGRRPCRRQPETDFFATSYSKFRLYKEVMLMSGDFLFSLMRVDCWLLVSVFLFFCTGGAAIHAEDAQVSLCNFS